MLDKNARDIGMQTSGDKEESIGLEHKVDGTIILLPRIKGVRRLRGETHINTKKGTTICPDSPYAKIVEEFGMDYDDSLFGTAVLGYN